MTQSILTRPAECSKFDDLRTEIDIVVREALKHRITDRETKDNALAYAGMVKRMRSALDERRKQITGPMQDLVKQIIAYAKILDSPMERAENHIRAEAVEYAKAIEAEQRREAERIRAEKARIEEEESAQRRSSAALSDTPEEHLKNLREIDESMIGRRVDLAAQKRDMKADAVKGVTEVWTFKVEDPKLVPREYLTVEETYIRMAVKRGVREIPGVRIFSETKVSIRQY